MDRIQSGVVDMTERCDPSCSEADQRRTHKAPEAQRRSREEDLDTLRLPMQRWAEAAVSMGRGVEVASSWAAVRYLSSVEHTWDSLLEGLETLTALVEGHFLS